MSKKLEKTGKRTSGCVFYASDTSRGGYKRVYHVCYESRYDVVKEIRGMCLGGEKMDTPEKHYLICTVFNYALESSWSGVYARYKVNIRDGECTYTVTKGWGDFRALAGEEIWKHVEDEHDKDKDGEEGASKKRGSYTKRLRSLSSGSVSTGKEDSSSHNYNSWSISSRIKYLNKVLERCCRDKPQEVRKWTEREGRRRSVLERWNDKGEWVKVDKPTGGILVMKKEERIEEGKEDEETEGKEGNVTVMKGKGGMVGGIKELVKDVDFVVIAIIAIAVGIDWKLGMGFVMGVVFKDIKARFLKGDGDDNDDDEDDDDGNGKKPKLKVGTSSRRGGRRLSDTGVVPDTPTTPTATAEGVGDGEIKPEDDILGSPLPTWPSSPVNCTSSPPANLFRVRGPTYFKDKVKIPSQDALFPLRGCDLWLTDNAMSDIASHPDMLGGKLRAKESLTVNFMMPWGNLVAYFDMSSYTPGSSKAWDRFLAGDQAYRDKRLKLLPVVVEGPWIAQRAIGPGNSPAVIGKALPVQYHVKKGEYFEIDLVVMASSVARGILSIVKSHTKSITIDLAFIIEGSKEDELPERVLGAFRLHNLDPNKCPKLRKLEEENEEEI